MEHSPVSSPFSGAVCVAGAFRDTALERAFREQQAPRDLRVARFAGCVSILCVLSFLSADYRLFGLEQPFPGLLAARMAAILATIVGLVILHRRPAPRVVDWTLTVWGMTQIALVLFVNTTRPRDFFAHNIYDVLVVLLAYVVLPLPLFPLTISPLALTIGNLLLLFLYKTPDDPLTAPAIVTAYVVANILGLAISLEAQRRKRLLFAALEEEKMLRRSLEQALAEIRTLRGLVPICAQCKKIRDDEGSWQAIETYVQERTYVEFSHGMCPECLNGMFERMSGS